MINTQTTAHVGRRSLIALIRLVVLCSLISSPLARAEPQHDVLVFLSLEGFDMFSASDPALDEFESLATASFLGTYSNDQFRFLAEYIWSDTENELERLQMAWQVDEQTTLWFGRFHSISNYWTTEFHHGQFTQTSISRPGLDAWEDESGPTPSHITGLWMEHEFSGNGRSAIDLGLAAGLAPTFTGDQLAPFDILDPATGHDLSVSGRLVYRSDVLSTNQIGIAVAHHDMLVDSDSNPNLVDLDSIRQLTVGLFANWSWNDWTLLGDFTYFSIDLQFFNGAVTDDFLMGYVQGEYAATEDWTIFGRTEFSRNEDTSLFLRLLPEVVAHRQMLGLRRDIGDSHALTLELADTSRQGDDFSHDNFKELRIQWSAVFP